MSSMFRPVSFLDSPLHMKMNVQFSRLSFALLDMVNLGSNDRPELSHHALSLARLVESSLYVFESHYPPPETRYLGFLV